MMNRQAYLRLAILSLAAIVASAMPAGALASSGDATGNPSAGPASVAGWHFSSYPLSSTYGAGFHITAGPDGALWFTEGGYIGRITTQGAVTEYLLPSQNSTGTIGGITRGPDGALWLTAASPSFANLIDRVATDGTTTQYPFPNDAFYVLNDIAYGPGSRLWFSDDRLAGGFGWITLQGTIHQIFTGEQNNGGNGIAASPDGAVWVTEGYPNKIGKLTAAGFAEYPIPTPGAGPDRIAAGPDGAMWFTELNANKIGRITADGQITEYPVPTANCYLTSIAAGPGGSMWFTELNGNKIGQITALGAAPGTITEYSLPAGQSRPGDIAWGSDGALWYTMWPGLGSTGLAIGRLGP